MSSSSVGTCATQAKARPARLTLAADNLLFAAQLREARASPPRSPEETYDAIVQCEFERGLKRRGFLKSSAIAASAVMIIR